LKQLLYISLLVTLLYKVAEPLVLAYRFTQAEALPLENAEDAEDAQLLELKFYCPLPYTSTWENDQLTAKAFQMDGMFYNTVSRRFENDTLYIKVQPNTNAHERFAALSDVINKLSSSDDSQQQDTPHKVYIPDFLKNYLGSNRPDIVRHLCVNLISSPSPNWHYSYFMANHHIEVVSPPPEVRFS
jgi:hypothetical protein